MKTLLIVLVVLLGIKYLFFFCGYLFAFLVNSVLYRKHTGGGGPRVESPGGPETRPGGGGKAAGLVVGFIIYLAGVTGRIPSQRVRMWLYRRVFKMASARGAVVYSGCEMRSCHKIEIGTGSIVGNECKLDGRNGISIGAHVNISSGVWIWTEQHDPQSPYFSTTGKGGQVVVKDRAWLSSRSTILPGVTIGEGAVIASGAVVTGDVEPFSIYGGVPAKKIGERNKDLGYEFQGEFLCFI